MQLTRSSDISVEQRLIEIGREMLMFTCGPDAVAFSRMMTSQAINFPDIAKLGREEGWLKAVSTTARFFDKLVAQGAMDVEDTGIAAEVFLDVVVGHTHRMATFGTPLEMKSAEKRMRSAIRLFLAGALGPSSRVQSMPQSEPFGVAPPADNSVRTVVSRAVRYSASLTKTKRYGMVLL